MARQGHHAAIGVHRDGAPGEGAVRANALLYLDSQLRVTGDRGALFGLGTSAHQGGRNECDSEKVGLVSHRTTPLLAHPIKPEGGALVAVGSAWKITRP